MKPVIRSLLLTCAFVAILGPCSGPTTRAAGSPGDRQVKGEAPPGHAIVQRTLGGAYFVKKSLKEAYDGLRAQVRELEDDVREGRVTEKEARSKIARLQGEIEEILATIHEKRVLVQPVAKHTLTETGTFELQDGQCLFIDASRMHVVGWEKPHVKWELAKTVLAANEAAEAINDWADIKLHRRSVPGSIFALPYEIDEGEEERLVAQSPFQPMWRRDLVMLNIDGLTAQQGNRQITVRLQSGGGEEALSSYWRRHAELTVYVPECDRVGIRGAGKGLEVRSLQADLSVSGEGNRDYEAENTIRDVRGNLFLRNVSMREIQNIKGNVKIVQTSSPENSGTRHSGKTRISYVAESEPIVCRDITGDVRAWFLRADVTFKDIGGTINVRNEFGTTRLVADKPLAETGHRIVSEAGSIRMKLDPEIFSVHPCVLATECGTMRVEGFRSKLKSANMTRHAGSLGRRRSWRIFQSAERNPELNATGFSLLRTIEKVLERQDGGDREPRVYLINRAGRIVLESAAMSSTLE